jgi:hypothetical protein
MVPPLRPRPDSAIIAAKLFWLFPMMSALFQFPTALAILETVDESVAEWVSQIAETFPQCKPRGFVLSNGIESSQKHLAGQSLNSEIGNRLPGP